MENKKFTTEYLQKHFFTGQKIQGRAYELWGTLKSKVDNHCQNNDVHGTYEKNSQLFVPREENKITVIANKERFDSLDKNIDEIKCDVKKLLQRG